MCVYIYFLLYIILKPDIVNKATKDYKGIKVFLEKKNKNR